MKTDVLIAGSGCSGLYCALNLPSALSVTVITKSDTESSDSFLAQGGICVLKDPSDYDSFFEDTMRAGHFENNTESVSVMINSSPEVIKNLVDMGVSFQKDEEGNFVYTREGAHSEKRILFHRDITGEEITKNLIAEARKRENITILEYTELLDIVVKDGRCIGGIIAEKDGNLKTIGASYVVLACGGIGGLYRHSTNFRHLTGDAIAIAIRNGVELKDINYIQFHPTTLYSESEEERSFLISESVRGEGARLYDKNMQRFVNELLPRDVVADAIRTCMKKDGTEHVWEDMRPIPEKEIKEHFPNIAAHCLTKNYDVIKECIPVVPAQHYFMGGIKVDINSKTSMPGLYAVGETACNGVHGKNRLASNSLLESLVFAGRAAAEISGNPKVAEEIGEIDLTPYKDIKKLKEEYRRLVLDEIEKENKKGDNKNV